MNETKNIIIRILGFAFVQFGGAIIAINEIKPIVILSYVILTVIGVLLVLLSFEKSN